MATLPVDAIADCWRARAKRAPGSRAMPRFDGPYSAWGSGGDILNINSGDGDDRRLAYVAGRCDICKDHVILLTKYLIYSHV